MATIDKNIVKMSLPKAIGRGNAYALDATSVWYDLEEMRAYAASSPISYVGQILTLVDESAATAKAYVIADAAGALNEVGSATLGDEKTISLDEDTLSLKNWGKQYYKWVEGEGENDGKHVLQIVDEDNPWIAGLEPKVVNSGSGFELAWYQPSSTTIEGVSSIVASVQTSVTNLTNAIGSAEDPAGAATVYGSIASVEEKNKANEEAIAALPETYLSKEGGTLTGALTLADGGVAISNIAVDTKIKAEIGSAGHLKRTIVNALPETANADKDTIYMVASPSAGDRDNYVEWMVIEDSETKEKTWEKIGNTNIDLSGYVKSDVTDKLSKDLTTHTGDTIVHITSEERTKWDEGAAKATENASAIAALVKIEQADADKLAALPAISSIGENLTLSSDGVLSANKPEEYVLPAATAEKLGGIKVGNGLSALEDGTLSVKVKAENGLSINELGELAFATASTDAAGALSAELFVKLTNLPANAEANTIGGLLMGNDVAATIDENKNLVLPFASTSSPGVVVASEEISVNEITGTMKLGKVSVSKLYVPEGEELVLNGGKA